MKQLFILILFSMMLLAQTVTARTVEIDVHGMTCAFCVDSLERNFGKMESISGIKVSLKQKKVRLETDDNHPSLEMIKKTVLDAGFTPTKVTVLTD
jgi:periplasmic mercuric ion binding protein